MPERSSVVDLTRLSLSHGEAARIEVPVHPDRVELGGQAYASVPADPVAALDVSRTSSGYALRLRLELRLDGPCMRCLADAATELRIDAREVDQPRSEDEELSSPYVDEEEVDVGRWARDAIVLAMPSRLLCRADCAGLCAVCGASLNDADPAEHRHAEGGDPRWAKLRELQ